MCDGMMRVEQPTTGFVLLAHESFLLSVEVSQSRVRLVCSTPVSVGMPYIGQQANKHARWKDEASEGENKKDQAKNPNRWASARLLRQVLTSPSTLLLIR